MATSIRCGLNRWTRWWTITKSWLWRVTNEFRWTRPCVSCSRSAIWKQQHRRRCHVPEYSTYRATTSVIRLSSSAGWNDGTRSANEINCSCCSTNTFHAVWNYWRVDGWEPSHRWSMCVTSKCSATSSVSFSRLTVSHKTLHLSILDCLLTTQNLPPDCPKDWWELYFVWATIWAIGGSLFQDQIVDYRVEFSKWFIHEFRSVKFPAQGTVFDYSIDPQSKRFEPWSKLVDEINFDPDSPVQVIRQVDPLLGIPSSGKLCFLVTTNTDERNSSIIILAWSSGQERCLSHVCGLSRHWQECDHQQPVGKVQRSKLHDLHRATELSDFLCELKEARFKEGSSRC